MNRGSTVNDGPGDGEADGVPFEDEISHDVGNFILSDPEVVEDEQGSSKRPPALPPTKTEMIEACFSPFHMLPALLARDGHFASTIGSQPLVRQTVIELIDEEMTKVLDRQCVHTITLGHDLRRANTVCIQSSMAPTLLPRHPHFIAVTRRHFHHGARTHGAAVLHFSTDSAI